jgi:DNA-binding NarL/FixJ family response regulator
MTIQRAGSFAAPRELAAGNVLARREATETRQDRVELHSVTTEALTALEDAAFAASVAAERAFSLTTVLDEALAVLAELGHSHPAVPSPRGATAGAAMLSPREREVLELVAEGRTNKAIAERLSVSPNTVKTHVTSLLTKLHADSRVQLAAIAARQGLG